MFRLRKRCCLNFASKAILNYLLWNASLSHKTDQTNPVHLKPKQTSHSSLLFHFSNSVRLRLESSRVSDSRCHYPQDLGSQLKLGSWPNTELPVNLTPLKPMRYEERHRHCNQPQGCCSKRIYPYGAKSSRSTYLLVWCYWHNISNIMYLSVTDQSV